MNQAPQGVLTASQITTYTALQLDSQYCMHVFSVLIVGDCAQLIQWNQSGAIATAPIYYQCNPELMDFFTCYDEAERPAWGHNGSVHKASLAEAKKAIYANKSFASPELLVVTVPCKDCESNCSDYIIKPPVARPYTPPSHAIRTSIAYDIQRDVVTCATHAGPTWT